MDLVGKARGRPLKFPKHCVEVNEIIKISDDSASDSEDMDSDSNSSPESLQDNDDVIFVNHINGHTGMSDLCRVVRHWCVSDFRRSQSRLKRFNVSRHKLGVCVCLLLARLEEQKHRLLAKIAELGKELPLNTLDELIDQFGGPEKVSEVRIQTNSNYFNTIFL